MMEPCVFCQPELEPRQKIVIQNETCMFLQSDRALIRGEPLEGASVIVPKAHRETVFALTTKEWQDTYDLLRKAKRYIDECHQPYGYNIGWNCGEVGGQHIFHAHLHVMPRYKEILAGKGIRYAFKGEGNLRSKIRYSTHPTSLT